MIGLEHLMQEYNIKLEGIYKDLTRKDIHVIVKTKMVIFTYLHAPSTAYLLSRCDTIFTFSFFIFTF
jgi:hypothetical protein